MEYSENQVFQSIERLVSLLEEILIDGGYDESEGGLIRFIRGELKRLLP